MTHPDIFPVHDSELVEDVREFMEGLEDGPIDAAQLLAQIVVLQAKHNLARSIGVNEILKLVVIINDHVGKGLDLHRDYILEKLERIAASRPIGLHPTLWWRYRGGLKDLFGFETEALCEEICGPCLTNAFNSWMEGLTN